MLFKCLLTFFLIVICYMLFQCDILLEAVFLKVFFLFLIEKYNLAFKIVRTESRLVRGILVNHGFHEVEL